MNTVRVLVISFAMLCLTTSIGKAATTGIVDGLVSTEMNAVAVPETAHMANLIGEWSMSSESRQQDGSWQSSEGQIADWNFFYTLDGQAIQDVWIAPPQDPARDPEYLWRQRLDDVLQGQGATADGVNDGLEQRVARARLHSFPNAPAAANRKNP